MKGCGKKKPSAFVWQIFIVYIHYWLLYTTCTVVVYNSVQAYLLMLYSDRDAALSHRKRRGVYKCI